MKNLSKLDVKTLLIIVLAVALLLMKMCGGETKKPGETIKIGGKKYEVLKHDIDTQYVPVTKIVTKKGKDIYHDTTIYVSLPMSFDTMEIIKNYFAKNTYRDTLKLDDSLGYIALLDTIQKNNILSRTWSSKVNKVTIKETTIVKEPAKNQLYVGINTTLNRVDIFSGVGMITTLKTKSDHMYNFGFGVMNSSNGGVPYINGGLQWKIKLR